MVRPRTHGDAMQQLAKRRLGPLLAAGLVFAGCAVGEAARSVCRVDLGDTSLRVLENDDTISVADPAQDDAVDAGLVFEKTDANVVLLRGETSVAVLALGRAEEAGGTWNDLAPDADCRLENGPALRVGSYTGGLATLDLDGTFVSLPAGVQLTTGELTSVSEPR